MPSVALYTLGCKVAQYETEALAEQFIKEGFELRSFEESADAYLINTCTVTAESDRKSRQIIRRAKKRNPAAVVAVVGCYSQLAPNEIQKLGVEVVLGTQDKLLAPKLVKERLKDGSLPDFCSVSDLSHADFERMSIKSAPRTRAYVKIEDGCESKCTYCAIKLARGRVRSKAREDVIREVGELYGGGVREIVLTGIETGAYGRDFDTGYTLGDLIRELDSLGMPDRIRLGSLAPELVGKDFAEKIRGTKILAPHFHISMQSGSDKVLNLMKRRYNSEMAYENIARLREIFPNAQFTTDMMVGFHGESEEDFLLSLDFIKKVGFLDVHVFSYSKRKGTEAYSFENQVPEEIKRERSRRMISFKNAIRDEQLSLIVKSGRELPVIAETELDCGIYSAHADNFAEIRFAVKDKRDVKGELVTVRPVSSKCGIIYAEEI